MQETVSIIIPTYRRADMLDSAIASVKLQSFQDWKVIVVDDNHPDQYRVETEAVMARYQQDPRVAYIQHESNKGACAARNTGWQSAKGEYIAFLDDDDLWDANKLKKQLAALNEHTDATFCYCDMYLTYQGLKKEFKCLSATNMYVTLLEQGYGVCTSALLIKRRALEDIGGFDNSLPSMQDYDLLLRLAKVSAGVHIKAPMLTYQLAEDGISCNPKTKVNGHKAIIDKYKAEFLALGLRKGLARQYESLGDFELRSEARLSGIKHYLASLSYSKLNSRVYVKLVFGSIFGKAPLEWYLARRQKRTSTLQSGN
ncbi:glycosyltransferase family A protein [Pseudoalteromonas piscicida]|uniref:Glycosyltransferase 2-like domain-containing protein n=1 Tax=Pseudoalteromonas piscicida TaxID=43662 RepID=A0ABN5CJM6_PSEO7|nr:glycosyltransferase family A protein [Pseudoalteromonas piscicida]ATD08946.1 hypothetical protein PPIS_a4297 [Pseudoalteromonas piscicida]WPU30928.1 glycosyltransferase family A protein [Pseudoalteromonas piscicida]